MSEVHVNAVLHGRRGRRRSSQERELVRQFKTPEFCSLFPGCSSQHHPTATSKKQQVPATSASKTAPAVTSSESHTEATSQAVLTTAQGASTPDSESDTSAPSQTSVADTLSSTVNQAFTTSFKSTQSLQTITNLAGLTASNIPSGSLSSNFASQMASTDPKPSTGTSVAPLSSNSSFSNPIESSQSVSGAAQSSNKSALVGGITGGLVGAIFLLVILASMLYRRRRKQHTAPSAEFLSTRRPIVAPFQRLGSTYEIPYTFNP